MTDETRQLARFVANLAYEDIPHHVRNLGINLLINTIGCVIGGSDLPWSRQVRETFKQPGGVAEATVLRFGDRLPVTAATFINSTFSHAFEFDDGTPPYHGHPGTEMIPAFMAIAERDHIPGREFLATLIAAYELRGRIGWAVSPTMSEHGGPHYSSGVGPFAAAAGVARLIKMDAEGIRNAIAISGSFSGGLMQYDQGGGSVKRIVCSIAGSSGIQSAFLAKAGMTGPEGILEGARGLLRIYCAEYLPERLVADFNKLWTIEGTLFKAYSCCGIIHAAIDGVKAIMADKGLKKESIASIEVGYPTGLCDHVAIKSPNDLAGMQFSTSYSLALTVLKGRNTPREYTLEALADAEIKEVASRIHVKEDKELAKTCKGHFPARVKIKAISGEVFEHLVVDAKGSSLSPLSNGEIDDKFRSQASDVIGKANCEELIQTIRNIDQLDDMAKLPAMLVVK